ncbi:MAG TPA: hypothetical protein VJ487_02230 [Alphaproteobacteria bacterium]|nr:hypothetical protein [Alphaproteobacteria bacterium]
MELLDFAARLAAADRLMKAPSSRDDTTIATARDKPRRMREAQGIIAVKRHYTPAGLTLHPGASFSSPDIRMISITMFW